MSLSSLSGSGSGSGSGFFSAFGSGLGCYIKKIKFTSLDHFFLIQEYSISNFTCFLCN